MPKNDLPYTRRTRVRATKKLCAIATEDSREGAYKYLLALGKKFSDDFVIRIKEIIPSINGKTEPKRILANLIPYGFDPNYDTCWVVSDVDSWGQAKLDNLVVECRRRQGIYTAISNNCFEIWLLYHEQGFNGSFQRSAECKAAGVDYVNRKGGLEEILTIEKTNFAIEKARRMPSAGENWPRTQGSHLYRLIEYLRTGDLPEV